MKKTIGVLAIVAVAGAAALWAVARTARSFQDFLNRHYDDEIEDDYHEVLHEDFPDPADASGD